VAPAPTAFIWFDRAYQRGDHLTVLTDGDRVATELDAAGERDLVPEVLARVGAVHAAQERYEPAIGYLEQALAMAAELAPPPSVAPTGPPPTAAPTPPPSLPSGLPGAPTMPGAPGGAGGMPMSTTAKRAARVANRLDGFELVLLDVDLRTGRYEDVLARATRLVDPTHQTDVRFAATRAHAAVLGTRGQAESAHHLLNPAAGIASRLRSRFRMALVEGDRAVLLANQGRLLEAITAADRVLPSMIRPAVGSTQLWSNADGASIAFTVSRAASLRGDHLTAQRMLVLGTTAAERAGGEYLQAHRQLAQGAFWLLEHQLDAAEAALIDAAHRFGVLGCTPALAIATMEQGRLAEARGLARSAGPLYRRALEDLRRLGHSREVGELNRLLTAFGPG
jgi:tetratricopeptide (TPR) repeat protein